MTSAMKLLACGLLLCVAWGAGAPAAGEGLRAYVFGASGAYLTVEQDLGVGTAGSLSRLDGIGQWLPDCSPGRASCYWEVASVAYHRAAGVAFAVVPQKAKSAPSNPPDWQVIAFRLPSLSPVARADLGACELPVLLLRPSHEELLAKCTVPKRPDQAEFETVVSVYDAGTMKLKGSVRETTDEQKYLMAQAVVSADFSDKAAFDAAGDVIFSGLTRLRFTGTSFHSETVDPIAWLDPTSRQQLEPFYRVQPVNNARWLPRALADLDGRRALMASVSADGASMALWTLALDRSAATPIMVVPAGIAHLASNGEKILVEATDAVPDTTAPQNTDKVGIWTVYDAATGQRLEQKDVTIARGTAPESELICLWPDGSRALFRQRDRLYAVETSATGTAREVSGSFVADPPLHCVFAP